MSNEQVEKEFERFFAKLLTIDPKMKELRIPFLLAFQEGLITGQEYVMNKLVP